MFIRGSDFNFQNRDYVAIQLFFAKQGSRHNEWKLRNRVKNDSAFHALFSPSCQLQLAWMDLVESTPEFAVAYDILLLLTFPEWKAGFFLGEEKPCIIRRWCSNIHFRLYIYIYIYGFCCCVGNARSISSFPSQYLFIYYRSWGRRTTCSTVMNFCTFTVNERAEIQTPARNCVELCLNASELSSHCGLAPGWIDLENNKFLHCKWKE